MPRSVLPREPPISVLIDRKNLAPLHLAWMLGTLIAGIAGALWYSSYIPASGRLPGGGSVPGLALGTVAGLIILFEFALWPRKTPLFRTARWLGKTQTWMKAHIWLGLLTVPFALLHCGFQFGGTYTSWLMWLLLIVIGSGVFGLAMQNILPRLLIERVPQETVATQIDEISRQLAADARRLVATYCEVEDEPHDNEGPQSVASPPEEYRQRVGVARRVGAVVVRSLDPELDRPQRTAAPAVTLALQQAIEPYLLTGKSAGGVLGSKSKDKWYFDDLRQKSPAAVRPAIDRIEALCQRRGELALQERLQFWLHSWLLIHLPLSVVLVVLLLGHVYFALRFG